MAGLSFGDASVRWRITALVLGCLLALVGPYVILTRAAPSGGSDDAARAVLSTSSASGLAVAPSRPATVAGRASSTSPRPTSGSGEVTGADVATASPLGEALESCRLQSLRVAASLGAAEVSLAQFEKHIDAMNLLVAGKISYAVATQFWDETRVGAAQNAAEFRRSQKSLSGSHTDCRKLDADVADTLPFGQVDQLNRCVAYVTSGTKALERADATVTTWQHHIHDMEMLRMGDITPAQATDKWRRNWHTGDRQLTAFQAAAKSTRAVRCGLD